MQSIKFRHTSALILLLMWQLPVLGADYAREQRWAQEIEPSIMVGEPLYLTAKRHRFLCLFTQVRSSKTAVIVVHGMGVHPDWDLIHVLRTRLVEGGYTTLALQMPVLQKDAGPDDYEPLLPEATERLAVATAFLASKGYEKIAIVAHSMGARMTNVFLVRAPPARIAAWVAIAMPGEFRNPEALKLPIFDVYAENDFTIVLEGVAARAAVIKRVPGARQIRVSEANHFFEGSEDGLLRHVQSYLDVTLGRPAINKSLSRKR